MLVVKNSPANAGDARDEVQSLDWEIPLEEGMATHCSILVWEIPWTEEPGGLQSIGSQRDRQEVTQHTHINKEARRNEVPLQRIFTLIINQELITRRINCQSNDHDILHLLIILQFKKYFDMYYLWETNKGD